MRHDRLSLALCLVLASWLVAPRASANTCDEPDGCPEQIFPMSALLFITGDIVFFAAQIAHAGSGRVMPYEWSVPELVFGALTIALGGGMSALAIARPGHALNDVLHAGAASAYTFGAWFTGHAIVSLVHRASLPPPVTFALTPLEGGAVGDLRGTF